MLLFSQLKEAVYHVVSDRYQDEDDYFDTISAVERHSNSQQLYRHFDVLNGKASSLLSHISIMIAVTGFLVANFSGSSENFDVLEYIIIFELVAYALLTIPFLSLTFLTNSLTPRRYSKGATSDEEIYRGYLRVFSIRRRHYYFVFVCMNVLNVMFVITVALKYGNFI